MVEKSTQGEKQKPKRRELLIVLLFQSSSILLCLLSLILGVVDSAAEEFVPIPLHALNQGDYSADEAVYSFQKIGLDLIVEVLLDREAHAEDISSRATAVAIDMLTPVPSITPGLDGRSISGGSQLDETILENPTSVPQPGETTFVEPSSTLTGQPTQQSTSQPINPPASWPTYPPYNSPLATPTPTNRPEKFSPETATLTPTISIQDTNTPTSSPTSTRQPTATDSPTASVTATNTVTLTPTASSTPLATGVPTITPTNSPVASATNSLTLTPSLTSTPTPVNAATLTPTESQNPIETHTPAHTPTQTAVMANTATLTPIVSPSPTLTNTPPVSPINTATNTPTSSPIPTATSTPTHTPTNAPPPNATYTPTSSPIPTATNTATIIPTASPTSTATNTSTSTPTPTATSTATNTSTSTPNVTPTSTETNTSTNTPTATPTPTTTNTPTATATATNSPTPTPSLPDCYVGLPPGATPSDDTFLRASSPTSNFGTQPEIEVRPDNGANRRGLIRFDLSAIPQGSTVTSATLYLFEKDKKLDQVTYLYRINSPWDENTVTWNFPWTTPGGDFDNSRAYASFLPNQSNCMLTLDLTDLVQEWVAGTPNYGFLLYSIGPNHILRYASKENGVVDQHPRLAVNYIESTPGISYLDILRDSFNLRRR